MLPLSAAKVLKMSYTRCLREIATGRVAVVKHSGFELLVSWNSVQARARELGIEAVSAK
jgi:hypothetical protein